MKNFLHDIKSFNIRNDLPDVKKSSLIVVDMQEVLQIFFFNIGFQKSFKWCTEETSPKIINLMKSSVFISYFYSNKCLSL